MYAIMDENMFNESYNKIIQYDYLNKLGNSCKDYVDHELGFLMTFVAHD